MRKRTMVTLPLLTVFALLIIATAWVVAGGGINRIKPVLAERLGRSIGRQVNIDGPLELVPALPPALRASDITIANNAGSTEKYLLTAERIRVTPDWSALLSGNLHLARVLIDDAALFLEPRKQGGWNLPSADSGTPAGQSPCLPLFRLEVTGSRVALSTPSNHYRAENISFLVDAQAPGKPSLIKGRMQYKGVPLLLEARLASPPAHDQNGCLYDVDLSLRARDNRLDAEGTLILPEPGLRFDLNVELEMQNPGLAEKFAQLPVRLDQPVSLKAKLHNLENERGFRLSDLDISSGPNDLHGWLELIPGTSPLSIKAGLKSTHLDVRSYLPSGHPVPVEQKQNQKDPDNGPLLSADPFDLSFFQGIDVDADLRAEVLKLPRLGLEDVNAGLRLSPDTIDLDLLKASVGNGELTGEVHLTPPAGDGRSLELEAGLTVNRFEVGRMLEILDLPRSVQGEMGIKARVTGKGDSPDALAAALDGRFSLVMKGGRLAAGYLKYAERFNFEMTDAFLNLFRAKEKNKSEMVNIECLVCRFDIRQGVAASSVLVFDTARAGVVGEGTIDLHSGALDVALKPVTGGGLGIPGLARFKLGTAPIVDAFKLGGTLQHPRIRVDKSETAFTLGKAVGGLMLFGPAGLTAALLETEFGENNPCVRALEEIGVLPE